MTERRVGIADLAVAAGEGTLCTLGLGSCVAIVLYDAEARVGGLAHVLLPDPGMSRLHENPARFPETAVPALLDGMRALGAETRRVTARLVGGASMFSSLLPRGAPTIGGRNVDSARKALREAGITIAGEDVGLEHGRSVYLRLDDGQVEVRSLARGSRVL
jgi:chemotaxis protein CheD